MRVLFLLPLIVASAWAASLTAVSTRPDMVSGGDVLLKIDLPEPYVVRLNGVETSVPGGLLKGLAAGRNLIEAASGDVSARLEVVNHPITGPVFSGPHEKPFLCQTQNFKLPDGTLLGPALDENCSVATRTDYVYKRAGGNMFVPLADHTAVPPDAAMTTTTLGAQVPYVVRVETGTINRAIYQISVLDDPNGWNKRLLYSFGGGCIRGWYRQGSTLGSSMISDAVTGKGYAEASSSLNVFGNNCNDLLAAETMMMVREHFIESYGPPLFTFGRGGSGGSYQQLQIADNYPGLLDGIIPSATFPDVLENTAFLTDVQLLDRYYKQIGDGLTGEQKRAIAGVAVLANVSGPAFEGARINPTAFCPAELPIAQRYDAALNPAGARCDLFGHAANVYGTGRPIDNTGLQYGPAALNAGVITADRFLDLNERIGGYDRDGNMVATRAVADLPALRAAYATGRVTNGGGGLAKIPIIDLRTYQDQTAAGNLHLRYHSFSLRERLRQANGTAANHIMIAGGSTDAFAIRMMDEWLTTGLKPAEMVDSCYSPTGELIVEEQLPVSGRCGALYPAFPSPRMVAGGPASNNILKCALKPVSPADYQTSFTPEQQSRLGSLFPSGVCDWSKPGVEQQKLKGAWLAF